MAYNWNEIRSKYETGKHSMIELAKEYGFNKSYGYQKSSKEKWEKGKTEEVVRQKVKEKILEEEGDKEYKLRKVYDRILNIIREKSLKNFLEDKDFDDFKKAKIMSETISNLRKEQWEINEIKEVAKRVEKDLDISSITGVEIELIDDET